jgi:hypothetical protein
VFHGLWIELKAPLPHRAALTSEQDEFLHRLRSLGYVAHVCYGAEDAIGTIKAYYASEGLCR